MRRCNAMFFKCFSEPKSLVLQIYKIIAKFINDFSLVSVGVDIDFHRRKNQEIKVEITTN